MRSVIQRVKEAEVRVDNKTVGKISKGLLVLLAVSRDDSIEDLDYILNKILGLRIFEDEAGKMNLSIEDVGGEILLVSQFTLYGDVRKGRRPSFTESAGPDKARDYYELMIDRLRSKGIKVETGSFGADMDVDLTNDGPVTILLDSSRLF